MSNLLFYFSDVVHALNSIIHTTLSSTWKCSSVKKSYTEYVEREWVSEWNRENRKIDMGDIKAYIF